MDKSELERLFVNLYKAKIRDGEQFLKDPRFDKMRTIMESELAYNLFYPIEKRFNSCIRPCLDIDIFLEFFSDMVYHVDDDGAWSFVYGQQISTPSFREGIEEGPFYMDEIFIAHGDRFELDKEYIGKQITYHGPQGMLPYRFIACAFNDEGIDFLFNLVPEFNKLRELSKIEDKYDDLDHPYTTKMNELEATFKEYITSHKYKSEWIYF